MTSRPSATLSFTSSEALSHGRIFQEKNKDEKYKNIKKKKLETTLEELCKGYPVEFKEYMEHCRSLKFEQDPDYKYCVNLFEKCMKRHSLDPKIMDFTWK